jgi:hypothetical protein
MDDDVAYYRRKLTERHGKMDEAGMTQAMLDYFVEVHRNEPPDLVEKSNRRGRPRGESREGDWMRDATDYARQVKHQMKGNTYSVNLKAAQKAARDFIDNDPYFAEYKFDDLWKTIRTGLRNNR